MTEWLYQIPTGKPFAYSTDGKSFFTVFSLPDGKPRFTRYVAAESAR